MEYKSKKYEDFFEMLDAAKKMSQFQSIHNILRKDYLELLKITQNNIQKEEPFNTLYRASLRSLFSLIEADIYGLNQLDAYFNYNDRHSFLTKFKNTFKQIAKTWNKEDIQKKYFDSKLKSLIDLKKMRDELVHPKEISHLHKASSQNFDTLQNVFYDYDKFMNELMNNFFIESKVPLSLI